ncbi:hypothetical protein [Arenibacter arenosicollis]|nr:hypothetical protein [Arenibacter arenosicollis]
MEVDKKYGAGAGNEEQQNWSNANVRVTKRIALDGKVALLN